MEVTMPPASNHPGSDNSIPSSEPPPTIHTHHPPSCSRVSSTQDQSYQFPSVPALSDKLNCMQEHGIGWALLSLLPYNDRPWIGRRGLFNVDHGDFLWWYAVLSMDKTWKRRWGWSFVIRIRCGSIVRAIFARGWDSGGVTSADWTAVNHVCVWDGGFGIGFWFANILYLA
jgi:hypothetical protein